ncbi:2Fe-2S ferredoxin-5 [Shimia sp. SK013]|uniref:2Fe-2S iron-sulfur cluster-binding protein n=1 Tax=Shimia sp. SK013 TaxID=1389006 RepID=UPI0006CD6CA1|nr:2Fe-2S iron-sulfur cluster-binding protein [Shimia sp. SK013]KPA23648.1 2Fe-2S ferredoxin-5 [Shimia sp. SK013]
MATTTNATPWLAAFRLRAMIVTGLVMFVFITMHLANLALGLISVQVMEDWRWALSGVWSSILPLKILLQVSLILHFLLALLSLYWRNTLRVPAYDMAQMIAGILIIPLLAKHVFGVMAAKEIGLEPTYALVLGQFWVVSPFDGLQQVVMLVVAWIHGAIGVYTWLQSRDGSTRIMRFFYPFVVALPTLAMLGYVEAGRQIIPVSEGGMGFVLTTDPNAAGPTAAPEAIQAIIDKANDSQKFATRLSLGFIALAFLARWLRLRSLKKGVAQVTYRGARTETFEAEAGLTLLEAARNNNLPHASVCRGRGRCGTCRVTVFAGAENLAPPTDMEAKVLAHWNAGPNERLACQIKPTGGALEVERVIEPDYSNLDYSEKRRPLEQSEGTV